MEENKKTKKVTSNKTTTTKKSKTNNSKKVVPKTVNSKKTSNSKKIVAKPTPEKKAKKTVLETYVINEEAAPAKKNIFNEEENENLREVVNKLEEENIVIDNKIIKRNKINKYIEIVLIILIITTIIFVTGYVIKEQTKINKNNMTLNSNIYSKVIENSKNRDNKEDKSENITEENDYSNIETISLSEFEAKILNKENITILISKSTCYYCVSYEPIINEVLNEQDKRIYRINILNLSTDEIEILRSYYKFIKTPTLFTVEDGIVKSELIGTKNKDDLSTWASENIK